MSVKVFVSSTKDDLDPDCRPRVLEAVAIAQAVAVAMENWPAEYLPALDLVKRKIDESTHYLGLFAYRRGWTPPGSRVSITEAEFDYATARLNGERVTVFVPTEDSEIAAVLRQRAEQAQDLADADAQTRFLERVLAAGAVEPFATVPDLSSRATRRVIFWNTPLLEQELRRANQARGTSNPHEVAALGRQAQVDCFAAEVLGRLAAAGGGTPAAGVLVSGPAGHGHPQLLARLRRLFEQVSRRTHPCTIGCGPLWRTGGLQSLLRVLARETGAPGLAGVPAAAAHLGTLLQQKDVVLQVTALQNYENGVAGFVEQFWAPLTAALPAANPYRLLCLASHEGKTPAAPAWDAAVQPCGADPFDPRRLVRLAPLEPFTAAELSLFVRPRVEPDQVAPLVAVLLETTEGVPGLIYEALADPSNWPS